MTSHTPHESTPSAQAAEWLCRLTEDGQRSNRSFQKWLRQSPKHVEEFLFVSATWQALRDASTHHPMSEEAILAEFRAERPRQNIVRLPASSGAPPAPRAHARGLRRWRFAAAVAGLSLVVALGWWIDLSRHTYRTAIGEQRIVRLEDGSVLYLNTDSRARIAFSDKQRSIRLLQGEALFVVAPDQDRPFQVSSSTATIRAVGTQFNVRRQQLQTVVSVLEGRVKLANVQTAGVTPEPRSNLLEAGQEASIPQEGEILTRTPADIRQSIAWRDRRLVFRNAPLEEVVAEINRYNTRRFYFVGDMAPDITLTASFDTDNPESLAKFLELSGKLTVERRGQRFLIRNATR